jgi:hypothetical protein
VTGGGDGGCRYEQWRYKPPKWGLKPSNIDFFHQQNFGDLTMRNGDLAMKKQD